jgi:hypothetical protein
MTIARFLLPGLVLLAGVSPAPAQPGVGRGGYRTDLVPSVVPAGMQDPAQPLAQPMPLPVPPNVSGLERMTLPPPTGTGPVDSYATLAGQPGPQGYAAPPPGSYPSPYYTDGPGCCGPLGRNGQIGYEVYTYAGVNIPFGEKGSLPDRMNTGWTAGGGVRTLFFNPAHTAAWTVDLGVSYTHNWAAGLDDPLFLFLRQPATRNPISGAAEAQPDRFTFTAIREVHRTSFNYNFGRDVWLWGSGNTGGCTGTNLRVGMWVGGRYGTSHVDQIPLDEENGYSRRQNVFHGIVVGGHVSFDIPMGGWILFGGIRAEYGHDWTNLTPPIQGNIHSVNVQFTAGVRY